MRLNKYLSNNGVTSRRKADDLIFAGKVKVDGVVVKEPWFEVKEKAQVDVEGEEIKSKKQDTMVLILFKPPEYIVSRDDPHGRKTIFDLLPKFDKNRLFYVGRLDYDTEGILLLTNNGELANKLMHPRYEINKTYLAWLNNNITEEDIIKLNQGVVVEDKAVNLKRVSIIKNDVKETRIMLTLHEGRNRIIKKLFETLGYRVNRLKRIGFHKFNLKDIKMGEYRQLKKYEIINLFKYFEGRK